MDCRGWIFTLALVAIFSAAAACSDDSGTSVRDVTPDAASDAVADVEDADAVADVLTDVPADADVLADLAIPTSCLAPEGADPTGTDALVDSEGTAAVTIDDRAACHRSYTLSTTADLRDDLPANPRTFAELDGWPTVRTGHDLFEALFALSLEEVRENSVEEVNNGAFNGGDSVPCGVGGCFETGRLWTYVWTRDTAYAMHLGLAALDTIRARNSLAFKTSERRVGGGRQIVQDTGTGGSYPVSSDRVAWSLGAEAVLDHLVGADREAFREMTLDALTNTIEHDRIVVFDETNGLYYGETSFLDWREQTYPTWTANHVIDIATSQALGTNLLHLQTLELAAALADEVGDDTRRDLYGGWADELRTAIRERLWLESEGMFSSYTANFLNPSSVRRHDLLGSALAILLDVANAEQAASMLGGYPTYGPGAPVIWPQQQGTRIYHNRGEWPFVTAYWLRAAAHGDNDAVAERMMRALFRGAAVNLSNMENFEAGSGAAWLDDGGFSGPVVNSQRQLWSVAGYVSMVHHTLFGVRLQGEESTIAPYLPVDLRNDWFAGTDELVLNEWPVGGRSVTVVLSLPAVGGDGGRYEIAEVRLNGVVVDGAVIARSDLRARNRIDVTLAAPDGPAAAMTVVSDEDWRDVFGPRTPFFGQFSEDGGNLVLELQIADDEEADVELSIYRDGEQVASGLPGLTTAWTDTDVDPASSPCYGIEATFTRSGNHSQHGRVKCWWGADGEHIQVVEASEFEAVGGEGVTNHGRFHYQDWGDPGDSLTIDGFTPDGSGEHLLQVLYGNGSGPINTGITCGVKHVAVYDEADDSLVAEGLLVMPQLGVWTRWADSSFVRAELDAAKSYRLVIGDGPGAENMSSFEHFATYSGEGGAAGVFNRVNIAELRVLRR